MSGNLDTTNNVNGSSGFVSSIKKKSYDDNSSSVENARSSINNLTNNINSSSNENSYVSSSYVGRGNNRRYSYANIRDNDAHGASAVSDGVDSGNFVSQSYVTKNGDRRYSYGNVRRDGPDSSNFVNQSYVTKNGNRRYSYARIREDGANQSGEVKGNEHYRSNTRFTAGQKKNAARTRSMTAKDNLFKRQNGNTYTYGSYVSGGQLMTRDSALDSLFYSDVANAMIDNGFSLSRGQRNDIADFQHEFSDEFAGFEFVDSDLLYQQAAIVDALITNGAFLTPEQENELGIESSLTSS